MPVFRGFYLNLDRNEARSASMTRRLAEIGMTERYQRFPALDGRSLGTDYVTKLDRGNLGLWLSHERLLAANKSSDAHLHLVEDDTVLPKDAEVCFANMLAAADRDFPDWDLILTDVFLNLDFGIFELINKCRKSHLQNGELKLYSLRNAPFACASSLFLNRNSIDKYLRAMQGRWIEGMPIDIFLRTQIHQGLLNAYVTLPFATSQSRDAVDSDIRGGLDVSRKVLNLYRNSLFKDADLKGLVVELRRLTDTAKVSDFAECYLTAARFVLSDQWVGF